MTRFSRTAAISLLVLFCAGTSRYAAQRIQTDTPGVIRINVNLVQVDAVVTDSKGKAVTDLKAEDFEIFQDNQPQKITNFEFVNVRGDVAREPVLDVVELPSKGPDSVAPPVERKVLKREEIRRTLAFVVDDLALSFDSTVRVRDSLKKWVETEMRPGDLVAVIRTSAGMGSLQRFTMDKQGINAAIDLLRYQPGRVGVSSFSAATGAPMEGLPDTSVFEDELEHTYLVGSLGAIQYVVRGLKDLPGRKSLILFSESMRFTFLQGSGIKTTSLTNATSETRLRRLADEASRSSVVIHAVDPRGVAFTGLTAEDNLNGLITPITEENEDGEEVVVGFDLSQVGRISANRDQQLIESRDGMIVLTQKTGGLFVKDNNDMRDAVRTAVNDGDGYYLLGYQPELSTFDESRKPVFHSIRVRVKRPGLTVRSRNGFFGNPDTDLSLSQTPREQLLKALVSPFASGDVAVRLTALYAPSDAGAAAIGALLHIDASGLTFAEEADGTRTSQADLVVVTFDGDGEQADTQARSWKINLSERAYRELATTGFVYQTVLPVKKAGPYQLRVVVRDTASRRLGSAMQYIDVPDLKKGRLTLSGIVMAGGPPSSPAAPAEGVSREQADSTPARRIFRSDSAVAFAYQILNARADADKKPQLETRVRLFRDGRQVYSGASTQLEIGSAPNAKRVTAGGSLRLNQLPPGEYVLQVIVADNLRSDKYRIATQAIDFQVQSKP